MKYFGITDRGRLRRTNQDSYVIATNECGDVFAMVCDGIGGGRGGDVASRIAVSFFSMVFSNTDGFADEGDLRKWLSHEISACNHEIYEAGQHNPDLKGMGTTLTGVLLTGEGRYVVNIGDSRTYSYNEKGDLVQLTTDHTLVQDMIAHGDLTPEEAVNFPRKNVLTNALGVWDHVKFDMVRHNEQISGFLICSDGLHSYVEHETIRSIVLQHDIDPALRARKILQAALDAGGFDNITAILIDLEGDEKREQFEH